MYLDVITLKKMTIEISADIYDFVFQTAGVGHYGCHIEGLSFPAFPKLRGLPVSLLSYQLTV